MWRVSGRDLLSQTNICTDYRDTFVCAMVLHKILDGRWCMAAIVALFWALFSLSRLFRSCGQFIVDRMFVVYLCVTYINGGIVKNDITQHNEEQIMAQKYFVVILVLSLEAVQKYPYRLHNTIHIQTNRMWCNIFALKLADGRAK